MESRAALEVDVLMHYDSEIQECIPHHGDIVSLLISEGVVSERVLDRKQLSSKPLSERNADIMHSVRVAVIADPRRMGVLIAVLEKFTESTPVAKKMRGALEIHGLASE